MFQRRKKQSEGRELASTPTEGQRRLKATFNSIGWHDSQFTNLSILEDEAADIGNIVMELRMVEYNYKRSSRAVFEGCLAVSLTIDLLSKRACSHQIGHGECFFDSDFKEQMKTREVPRLEILSLEDYLHFEIWLVPPAGNLKILARNFILEPPS